MNGRWSLTIPTIELSEVGDYDGAGLYDPASRRYNDSLPSSDYDDSAFRLALYL